MARAKRTERADARRRYRAAQPEVDDTGGSGAEIATPAAKNAATPAAKTPAKAASRPAPRQSDAPAARPTFMGAFRAAARPIDVRSDLRYLPTLLFHWPDARAIWFPGLAALGSGALFLAAQPLGSNGLANLAFQLFVLPPTIAGAFLAGILAPRATYIAGGIAALIGAIVFAFAVAVTPTNISAAVVPTASPSPGASASVAASPAASDGASAAPSASPEPSAAPSSPPATDSDKVTAIVQSVLLSVPFGIAIGAFGGYYKRFLYASNPSRQRKALEQQRQKAQRSQGNKKRY